MIRFCWRLRAASTERTPGMNLDLNVGLVKHLGMRFIEATPERVVAELEIREEVCTVGGAIHGGTLMALADTAGAVGALSFLEKKPAAGKATPTLRSKTHLFAAARSGEGPPQSSSP